MALTEGQQAAFDKMMAFVDSPTGDTFCLRGGAGSGKTYLVSQFIKALVQRRDRRIVSAAPTHKACRVLRSKLGAAGIPWAFKPRNDAVPGLHVVLNDTVAALIGMRMSITENQDEKSEFFESYVELVKINKVLEGSRGGKPILIVDEASMVARDELALIKETVDGGAKLIFVGDEGQLPPVNKEGINFETDFDSSVELTEIVRQAKDSAIIRFAYAVRRNEQITAELLQGAGIIQAASPVDWYLENLKLPVDDEGKRSVFIAFTNAWVNTVQELACQQLYGHGATTFKAGQLVLSSSSLEGKLFKEDQLRIISIEAKVDPVYGQACYLERLDVPVGASDRKFAAFYMSNDVRADPTHLYNVKLREKLALAKAFQAKYNKAEPKSIERQMVDGQRRRAWTAYYEHKRSIVSFVHPFAITSHRSQGSTYETAVIHASELLQYDRRALYVASTRPSSTLVL